MLFSVKKEKHNIAHYIPIFLLITMVFGFAFFSSHALSDNSVRNREVLEKALNRSISQCYALEGMYPPSLDYLIDNYGLTYDSEHYFIDYRFIGSNLRPDVTIIERN